MYKHIKPYINRYDTPATMLVVSLYPKKGELYSEGTSGLASYAKNVVRNMDRPVVVLANYDKKPEVYEEGNALVIRCFRRGVPNMWLSILTVLKDFVHARKVLIQYDFAVYGSLVTSALILPFLMALKVMDKAPYIVSHHVVTDVHKLTGHLGIGKGLDRQIKVPLYNMLFHTFYRMVSALSAKIVVLEEPLERKLTKILPEGKVITIPHGVDTERTRITKREARKILGFKQDEYIVMYFGFINWFKGADFFADTFAGVKTMLGKNVQFVMAGGISPTMKDKGFYRDYFSRLAETIHTSHSLSMTGYIPQEQIEQYFAACDLVVFPYRDFMTASGVLSLAITFGKPFVLSHEVGNILQGEDFRQALKETQLAKGNITFPLTKDGCRAKVRSVLANGTKKKTVKLTNKLRKHRSYERIGVMYGGVLFAPAHKIAVNMQLRYT